MTPSRTMRRNMPLAYAEAKAGNWTTEIRNGHLRIRRGDHLVITSSTPSDTRSDKNTRSQLRRCQRGQCSCRTAIKERAS